MFEAEGQAAPFLAYNLANMPIRDSGECGRAEARWAPQARSGSTEDRGVVSFILTLATTILLHMAKGTRLPMAFTQLLERVDGGGVQVDHSDVEALSR